MRRVESSPNDSVSTPSPMHTGSMATAVCAVAVSGNAVTTREEVIVDSEKEVKVVVGLETVTGTEVMNVVKLELRDPEDGEVALTGMGEVDGGRPVEDDVTVADEDEDVGGVAENEGDGDESVREEAVGKKVEFPLVVHQLFLKESVCIAVVSSLACRSTSR